MMKNSPPALPVSDNSLFNFYRWLVYVVDNYPAVVSPPALQNPTPFLTWAIHVSQGGEFTSPPAFPQDPDTHNFYHWFIQEIRTLSGNNNV